MLTPEFVKIHGLAYVTSDVSPEELMLADEAFEKLVIDMAAKEIDPALLGTFDAVVSNMVLEHVADGRQYYSNVYKLLRPGGVSAQCFSTLWSLPFAVNRLLPEALCDALLNIFHPRDRSGDKRFKAYYSWGRGPSARMVRKFVGLGFEVVRYSDYFGHLYYRNRLPWLHWLDGKKSRFLARRPIPLLCSYACLVLRKPIDAKSGEPGA